MPRARPREDDPAGPKSSPALAADHHALRVTGEDHDGPGRRDLICPACSDDDTKDYTAVTPELQQLRGPYPKVEAARIALQKHIGLNNRQTRLG